MDLKEFAREIHENAKAHGWWDGERDDAEIIALIHSEWSEALEEYRAGRPLVWYECAEMAKNFGVLRICEKDRCFAKSNCQFERNLKPEGIAVELIDGCIRILDYFAASGEKMEWLSETGMNDFEERCMDCQKQVNLPMLVARLHRYTSDAMNDDFNKINYTFALHICLANCAVWIKQQGIDPDAVMLEKHEYNKTRPYRHGGKVC